MEIVTRFSISADGYVTTPEGWPALMRDPGYVGGLSHGFPEFQLRRGPDGPHDVLAGTRRRPLAMA
jgi:hypothetical protein